MLVFLLHLSGIFFFTNGFLLHRKEVPFKSLCSDFNLSLCSNQTTWTQYKNIIIVIIDGLRFDYALFNHTINNTRKLNNQKAFYINEMPIFDQLIKSKPKRTRIFRFSYFNSKNFFIR